MDEKTKIIHSGHGTDPHTGGSSVPIYQISTYAQKDPLEIGYYEYGRGQNPTRDALEETIASLENGSRGFAFASGVAAIASTLMLFKPGDHVVVTEDVYGGTFRLFTDLFARWGLKADFVDFSNSEAVEEAITDKTVALYAETPSNPILKITDLAAIGDLCKRRKVLGIIDNTFMTPYLQRPLDFGFDIVLHSATKFLGGHSDLIAGLAVTKDDDLGARLKNVLNSFGAILGPQDSWLVLRGIKTLSARMDAQQKTAGEVAKWLTSQEAVRQVYYPSLPGHPGSAIHLSQSGGGGAVVSFEFGSGKFTQDFLRALTLPIIAVSLGGVESIASYPATMSHAAMPQKEREERGIRDGLVRLSVGLESPGDLKEDIRKAIEKARNIN